MEFEIFIVKKDTFELASYYDETGQEAILKELAARYGWLPVFEEDYVIGLQRGDAAITLEPAGQIELSGAPYLKLQDCIKEYKQFLAELKSICDPWGLGLMTLGYHPLGTIDSVPKIPKSRYKVLAGHLDTYGGPLAIHMMKLTTSIQTNIDYASEEDFRDKVRAASVLVPLLTAIYGNSPFYQNRESGYLSYRSHVWDNTDDARCGILKHSFIEDFGYEDYVEYLLDIPMVMRYQGDEPIIMEGKPFRQYWHEDGASWDDWQLHMSFPFPEVRIKQYIEIRPCDNQRPEMAATIPALLKGLFYCPSSLKTFNELFKDISWEEAVELKSRANKSGLHAGFRNRSLLDIACEVFTIAEDGLSQISPSDPFDKEILLPLKEYLFEKGCSPAEELLNLVKGKNIRNLKDYLLI